MTTRIKLRRDTAANWTTNNPILAAGEPGLETDTGKIKYGDGTTSWTGLHYGGGGNIESTKRGFVNLLGQKPNDDDNIWFEAVTVGGDYAYVLGSDEYVNDSNGISKIYKYDLLTGEQVWVKAIQAGHGAEFSFNYDQIEVTITNIDNAGLGYVAGEELIITGGYFNGLQAANAATFIVDSVDGETGAILAVSVKPGWTPSGETGSYSYVSPENDGAIGDTNTIAYDVNADRIIVASEYNSGFGDDRLDNSWTWTKLITLNPETGAVTNAKIISADGDVFTNSIKTFDKADGIAIVGEKYGEFRLFGTLTMTNTGDSFFDILKSNLDAEHYPGAQFNDYSDFWITGTGIDSMANIDQLNYYPNAGGTTREGSGATFDVTADGSGNYSVSIPSTVDATISTVDLATATGSGDLVVNADNIVSPGGWGNWLVFPAGSVATALEGLYTMNQVVPVIWGAGSTALTGYVMVQIPGDGTVQFTPVQQDGQEAIAGTWYFPMSFGSVTPQGSNYLAGHKIKVLGSALGGVDVDNDAIVTVTAVSSGAITAATISGTSTGSATYAAATGTNYQVGSGFNLSIRVNQFTGAFEWGGSNSNGSNYVVGDVITFAGTAFAGGVSTANDATLTVTDTGGGGELWNGSFSGTAPTNILRIQVNGVDFTAEGGSWSMKQNLGGEAFVWTPNWSNAIGGPSGDRFYDVCWSADGNYLYAVGRGSYEVDYDQALAVKFNANTGAIVWSQDIKFDEAVDNNREARAVCLVPDSTDIMVAGMWWNSDGGENEVILTRMTSAGEAVWTNTYQLDIGYGMDYEISLSATGGNIVLSIEHGTFNNRGLGYLVFDTDGEIILSRVLSSDSNSNYNYYNTPTANFADVYTDTTGDYVVMAGYTYVPTDNYYNALLIKLPLDGYNADMVEETGRINFAEHTYATYNWTKVTKTPGFVSFTATEHNDTLGLFETNKQYVTQAPEAELRNWLFTITDDSASGVEFGDGSKQSFATHVIPQIPAANDYFLTAQDSGKHIYFQEDNGTVYIPHWSNANLPIGFTFTLVNTTGSDCYVECLYQNGFNNGELWMAGRDMQTPRIGIPDSGSGSMVTLLKIRNGYTNPNADGNSEYPEVWMVSGPGDVYNDD